MEEEYRRHAILDGSNDCDDEIVSEWEAGLPDLDELMPLSQSLIPDDLASAFGVPPEPCRSQNDVARAFEETISTLRLASSLSPFQPNSNGNERNQTGTPQPQPDTATGTMLLIDEDVGADPRKSRRMDTAEDADSAPRTDNSAEDQSSARALKRPRLVWTPQLHKRFVEVVSHLGINNAVPKTIMQMMNVEGLTRENVASHLQKYRLYLKRQSREDPALSDQIFSSEPYPHQIGQQQQQQQQQQKQPRPVIPIVNTSSYHPFDSHHHFNIMQRHQQRDWSSANNYATLASPAND